MTWATVAGLAVVLALATLAAKAWTALCRRNDRQCLEDDYAAAQDALAQALSDEPHNLQLHLRLRASLLRLRNRLDAIDASRD